MSLINIQVPTTYSGYIRKAVESWLRQRRGILEGSLNMPIPTANTTSGFGGI